MDDEQPPEEKVHVATQRDASRAGLMFALFMVLLSGAATFAVVNLWPLFVAAPVSQPETNLQE